MFLPSRSSGLPLQPLTPTTILIFRISTSGASTWTAKGSLRGALLIEILRFPILVALFNGLSPEFIATGSPPSFELDYSSRVAGSTSNIVNMDSIFNNIGPPRQQTDVIFQSMSYETAPILWLHFQ